MSPFQKNIVVPIGATFSLRWLLQSKSDGFSFDLTGYTVVAQIRETAASRKKICDMTGIVYDAVTGDFGVSISAATTSAFKPGVYCWDLKLVGSSATLYPLAGKATVAQTVTR